MRRRSCQPLAAIYQTIFVPMHASSLRFLFGVALLFGASAAAQVESEAKLAEQLVSKWWQVVDRDAQLANERCQQSRAADPIFPGSSDIASPEFVLRISKTFGPCVLRRYARSITGVSIEKDALTVEASIRTVQPTSASGPADIERAYTAPVSYRYVFRFAGNQWRLVDVFRMSVSSIASLDASYKGQWEQLYVPRAITLEPPPWLQ